jgi:uncharacterized OsmC-like protein
MGEKHGGAGAGPTPGTVGRAALGTCLAIGYRQWAAMLGVPIVSLEIEIQADYDSGAMYGTTNAGPGYSAVRYIVSIESPADAETIARLLDTADAHSPYRAVFAEPQAMTREVRLRSVSGSSAAAPE